jgi:hypothetical protein
MAPVADPDATDEANRNVGWDIVDQWGEESFPASDPPANW